MTHFITTKLLMLAHPINYAIYPCQTEYGIKFPTRLSLNYLKRFYIFSKHIEFFNPMSFTFYEIILEKKNRTMRAYLGAKKSNCKGHSTPPFIPMLPSTPNLQPNRPTLENPSHPPTLWRHLMMGHQLPVWPRWERGPWVDRVSEGRVLVVSSISQEENEVCFSNEMTY